MSNSALLGSEPFSKPKHDLSQLARFGANISDAHSCFIFLPLDLNRALTSSWSSSDRPQDGLVLAGYHSLSADVIENCHLQKSTGLIGWVATHVRSIHVSPFEHDSRTLGIYSGEHELKSFIGIPVLFEDFRVGESQAVGVIACDSKKSFAFSKLQGKLLEDLSKEISNTVQLLVGVNSQGASEHAWLTFLRRSEQLRAALGHQAVEILRLSMLNYTQLELRSGTSAAAARFEQIYRLIQQALPPHFPLVRLVNGDILIAIDSMMTTFYENKIKALCQHIRNDGLGPEFAFAKGSLVKASQAKARATSAEELVTMTASPPNTTGGFSKNLLQRALG